MAKPKPIDQRVQEDDTPVYIEPDPPSHAVSVVEGHHGRLYPRSLDMSPLDYPTNFVRGSWEHRAAVMAAGNPGDVDFADGVVRFSAVNFLIFPEERMDPETGELGTFARTCLFDGKGRTFRTTAAHAPHKVAAALDLFTPEEWAKGIPFIIRERTSSKTKRTYHDIRLDSVAQ